MPEKTMSIEEFHASGLQLRRGAITDYKAELVRQILEAGLPTPEPEFRFHPDRQYRADWKVGERVLVEYQGGVYQSQATGHRSVGGVTRDIEKLNEAVSLDYVVIQVTPAMVVSGAALRYIKIAVRKEAIRAKLSDEAQTKRDAARALRSLGKGVISIAANLDDAA